MSGVTIIGIDLAKRIFHLHGAGHDGSVVFRKRLSLGQLLAFMSQVPQCVVAMEACATAHGISPTGERGTSVITRFVQQSPGDCRVLCGLITRDPRQQVMGSILGRE